MGELVHALKEWQIAVNALEQGHLILLLRKGGIREGKRRFSIEQNPVLLYPTFEHQQADLLKPEYATQVKAVASGWHPEQVRIGSWALISHVFQVMDGEPLAALSRFHIWSPTFVVERLRWQPSQPLYVLLLRVYRLAKSEMIPYAPTYGGCRSWIELEQAIALDDSQPVLDNPTYDQQVNAIQTVLGR
jgi:hypothetical protein